MSGKLKQTAGRVNLTTRRIATNPLGNPAKNLAALPGNRAGRRLALYGGSMEPQTEEELRAEKARLRGEGYDFYGRPLKSRKTLLGGSNRT